MISEAQKITSCVEYLGELPMDARTYVRENLADYWGVFSNEITDEDKMTNVQADALMRDAGRYFNFRCFLHESTFSETNPFFTVSQCIKLIRLHLDKYKFLLDGTTFQIYSISGL